MRHATARAMERLRWPKGAREVQYIFPIAKLACGAEYDGGDVFRAEDAYAILNDLKTSSIQNGPSIISRLFYDVGWNKQLTPRIKKREWKMPDCPTCCVELDWALEHPYVIHAAWHVFERSLMVAPRRRLTPQEKLDEQKIHTPHKKVLCGELLLANTPLFTGLELRRAQTRGDTPWLPTCEVCREKVLEHFGLIKPNSQSR